MAGCDHQDQTAGSLPLAVHAPAQTSSPFTRREIDMAALRSSISAIAHPDPLTKEIALADVDGVLSNALFALFVWFPHESINKGSSQCGSSFPVSNLWSTPRHGCADSF